MDAVGDQACRGLQTAAEAGLAPFRLDCFDLPHAAFRAPYCMEPLLLACPRREHRPTHRHLCRVIGLLSATTSSYEPLSHVSTSSGSRMVIIALGWMGATRSFGSRVTIVKPPPSLVRCQNAATGNTRWSVLNHISPFSGGLPSPRSCLSGENSQNSVKGTIQRFCGFSANLRHWASLSCRTFVIGHFAPPPSTSQVITSQARSPSCSRTT